MKGKEQRILLNPTISDIFFKSSPPPRARGYVPNAIHLLHLDFSTCRNSSVGRALDWRSKVRPHACSAKKGEYELKFRLYVEIKEKARDKSKPARKTPTPRLVNPIARKFYEESVSNLQPGENPLVVKKKTLERAANRIRTRIRPTHPTDLFFEPNAEHLPPKYLRHIVTVGKGKRQSVTSFLRQRTSWPVRGESRDGILTVPFVSIKNRFSSYF